MVIKSTAKTKAKQRKEAIKRWKVKPPLLQLTILEIFITNFNHQNNIAEVTERTAETHKNSKEPRSQIGPYIIWSCLPFIKLFGGIFNITKEAQEKEDSESKDQRYSGAAHMAQGVNTLLASMVPFLSFSDIIFIGPISILILINKKKRKPRGSHDGMLSLENGQGYGTCPAVQMTQHCSYPQTDKVPVTQTLS